MHPCRDCTIRHQDIGCLYILKSRGKQKCTTHGLRHTTHSHTQARTGDSHSRSLRSLALPCLKSQQGRWSPRRNLAESLGFLACGLWGESCGTIWRRHRDCSCVSTKSWTFPLNFSDTQSLQPYVTIPALSCSNPDFGQLRAYRKMAEWQKEDKCPQACSSSSTWNPWQPHTIREQVLPL